MELNERLAAFKKLGDYLRSFISADETTRDPELNRLVNSSANYNPWFTKENVLKSLGALAGMLNGTELSQWAGHYGDKLAGAVKKPKVIGVVMAGNIPMVGFHDMLCVLISGNTFLGKTSSQDPMLVPFLAKKLIELELQFEQRIRFTARLENFDAVIATGSNNTARYFDYYFGKYPNIIRKNRNSVAVLSGNETKEELKRLGEDIFSYFGLGCRNVSKLIVPADYKLDGFFEAIEELSSVATHHKYVNNYDYNKAIYLVNRVPFLDNNFLLLKEDPSLISPIGVLFYEKYNSSAEVESWLKENAEAIQCIVSSEIKGAIPFGGTQNPHVWDYADNIDTMEFLLSL